MIRPMFAHRRRPALAARLWHIPWGLLALASALGAAGVATLYSVAGGSFQPWGERHALRLVVGIGAVLAMALLPVRIYLRLAWPLYAATLVALALVAISGTEALGARRWLAFGALSFQPSELMKLTLVLALAAYYRAVGGRAVSSALHVLVPVVLIAIPAALILRQPDLGTAVLLVVLGGSLMFMAGVGWGYFAAASLAVVAALPLVWSGMHDYQRRRIEVFLDPERDPLGAGYHILQSKIALGAGGVTGRGFLQGTQSQLDFLPEKHTDFIFTMIGEEWGLLGAAAIMVLLLLMSWVLMSMAISCRSAGGRILIAGASLNIFLHGFVNVAMTTGLLPVVGIPLPLVSYGGTSMLTIMAGLGLAIVAHIDEQVAAHQGYV